VVQRFGRCVCVWEVVQSERIGYSGLSFLTGEELLLDWRGRTMAVRGELVHPESRLNYSLFIEWRGEALDRTRQQ
jgi:hypothetical protein